MFAVFFYFLIVFIGEMANGPVLVVGRGIAVLFAVLIIRLAGQVSFFIVEAVEPLLFALLKITFKP